MFNVNLLLRPLPTPTFDFYGDIRLLYNELSIYNSNNDERKPLSINSTLLDIEDHFGMRTDFENEASKRKQIAPSWKTALTLWIFEIEHFMLGLDADDDYVNLYQHANKMLCLAN